MNIYRCVSEELLWHDIILDDGTGPWEPYYITELVAAPSRGRAKWLAWKSDKDSFTGRMGDMPKFSVVCTRKDTNLSEGLIAGARRAWWWATPQEAREELRESREARQAMREDCLVALPRGIPDSELASGRFGPAPLEDE